MSLGCHLYNFVVMNYENDFFDREDIMYNGEMIDCVSICCGTGNCLVGNFDQLFFCNL